ncbi:hypothetical protein ERO13_1Z049345v2 [Gossypium hirsutum]|nr:hypothetical protein ERO13_1Z049345v2 [Gossypium hirsutum]
MHSACFQDYTCTHYTCPICSKSLGDMQVYFKMLDAFLAEEKFQMNIMTEIRQYYAMTVRQKEQLPTIGSIISAPTVAHITREYYRR